MKNDQIIEGAAGLLADMRAKGLKIAVAESCTGGLVCAALTEVAGSSDVFERGFVSYSNAAKAELLGVPEALIVEYGAVSAQVAEAMARGALDHSQADIGVSVTGIAGPGGGSDEKPVGLVYLSACLCDGHSVAVTCRFGDEGRQGVRKKSVLAAFTLVRRLLGGDYGGDGA